jgi:HSP20 family molecular chaperone IbpA
MTEHDNAGSGFGLDGLLRGLGELLRQAANIAADARRGEGQRPVMESHMSVRSVDGEEIGADFFGLGDLAASPAAQPGEASAQSPEHREPAVDIIATADTISAIVELPGAEPGTLAVRVEHDMLTVAANGRGVEYAAEALLPQPVDDAARELSFRNGVLELKWPRAEPGA